MSTFLISFSGCVKIDNKVNKSQLSQEYNRKRKNINYETSFKSTNY